MYHCTLLVYLKNGGKIGHNLIQNFLKFCDNVLYFDLSSSDNTPQSITTLINDQKLPIKLILEQSHPNIGLISHEKMFKLAIKSPLTQNSQYFWYVTRGYNILTIDHQIPNQYDILNFWHQVNQHKDINHFAIINSKGKQIKILYRNINNLHDPHHFQLHYDANTSNNQLYLIKGFILIYNHVF